MNPERARLPNGFKESLSLSFSCVRSGSALAEVRRDTSIEDRLPISYHGIDFLSLAQARFLKIVTAANNHTPVSPLPHKLRPDLVKLAENIREHERLEIAAFSTNSDRTTRVRYSRQTCDRLVAAVRVPGFKEIAGLAIVTAIDDALEKVKLISEFGVFSFPVDRSVLRAEFSNALNCTVTFSCQVKVAQSGAITSVTEARALALLPASAETLRLESRLKDVEKLADGWRDGFGIKIPTKVMHKARDIGRFVSAKYSGIAAFAQVDGSMTFEFSVDGIEAIVTIKSDLIQVEAFDDSDADMRSVAFFAVTPRLLAVLSDLKDFLA